VSHLNRTPLGPSTTVGKWYIDINVGTHAAADWKAINGVTEINPKHEPTLQDDSDSDSGGYRSSTVTALAWSVDLKIARKPTAADLTVYDTGQEALRAKAALIGISNRTEIRYYEVTPSGPVAEAYMGYVAVSYSESGGALDALDEVALTLTGQGDRAEITHPDYAAAVPVIYSATPSTGLPAAGGTLIKILGKNFFLSGVDDVVATTGVKAEAHNFGGWITDSDSVIFAITPAETAGSSTLTVTNSTGVSTVTIELTYV